MLFKCFWTNAWKTNELQVRNVDNSHGWWFSFPHSSTEQLKRAILQKDSNRVENMFRFPLTIPELVCHTKLKTISMKPYFIASQRPIKRISIRATQSMSAQSDENLILSIEGNLRTASMILNSSKINVRCMVVHGIVFVLVISFSTWNIHLITSFSFIWSVTSTYD